MIVWGVQRSVSEGIIKGNLVRRVSSRWSWEVCTRQRSGEPVSWNNNNCSDCCEWFQSVIGEEVDVVTTPKVEEGGLIAGVPVSDTGSEEDLLVQDDS